MTTCEIPEHDWKVLTAGVTDEHTLTLIRHAYTKGFIEGLSAVGARIWQLPIPTKAPAPKVEGEAA